MDGRASFSIVSTYYNARQCVWEPFIEPVYDPCAKSRRFLPADAQGGDETIAGDKPPWSLRLEVSRISEVQNFLLYSDIVAEKKLDVTSMWSFGLGFLVFL